MAAPIVPILVTTAVIGAGVGGVIYVQRQQDEKKAKAKKKKKSGTNGKKNGKKTPVFAKNAALGNSPEVVAQVALPIELGELGPVSIRLPKTGNITTYKKLAIREGEVIGNGKKLTLTPKQALEGLVTNMSPAATKQVWESLKKDVTTDGGVTFDMPSKDMDRVLKRVLSEAKPDSDWSKGLSPYTATSPEVALWVGTILLGELLYQSVWNSYTEDQDEPVPTPGPMPGGSGNAQVDAQWDNWFNKGELQGQIAEVASGNFGPTTKGFFAQLKVFEDDLTRTDGTYTGVASYDSPTDDGLVVLYGTDAGDVLTRLRNAIKAKEQTL